MMHYEGYAAQVVASLFFPSWSLLVLVIAGPGKGSRSQTAKKCQQHERRLDMADNSLQDDELYLPRSK